MSFDTFKSIIQKIPGLRSINLFKWGEPFLNPDIFKMIKYAKSHKIKVCINSNFSLKRNADFFTDIATSGLDELILSIDGASCQSYSKYRSSGDFDLVISNLKHLIHAKKLLKRPTPKITWKLIVNKFNEDEIKLAKRMAHGLGVGFEIDKISLGDDLPDMELNGTIEQQKEQWLPTGRKYIFDFYIGKYKRPLYAGPCKFLFNSLVVNPDGKVSPCCWITDQRNVFGDLLKDSISEIWNNNKYLYSRSLFLQKEYRGPKEKTVCEKCTNYKKARHPACLLPTISHHLAILDENH